MVPEKLNWHVNESWMVIWDQIMWKSVVEAVGLLRHGVETSSLRAADGRAGTPAPRSGSDDERWLLDGACCSPKRKPPIHPLPDAKPSIVRRKTQAPAAPVVNEPGRLIHEIEDDAGLEGLINVVPV